LKGFGVVFKMGLLKLKSGFNQRCKEEVEEVVVVVL
jgi:hypothetical protein